MSDEYAIVQAGGHQLKLSVGQSVTIDRRPESPGTNVVFDQVLLVRQGEALHAGRPRVADAHVVCAVTQHRRGGKITVFKFRRRENYHRTIGHRSDLTDLTVKAIQL